MSFLNCIIISFLWHVEYSGVWCLPYAISTNLILSPAVLHVTRSDLFMMSQHKQKQIWPQDWAHILLLFERKRHHPKNKIYILSDVSCLFVMQSEAQLDRVSFKFIPPSISLCPRGWENGLECPSLFLDPLLSGPLIYTLDADSSGSQPALNKKKKNGGEEVAGMGGRERELGRTKLGVGRNWTQCLLCVWREDLAQTLAGL